VHAYVREDGREPLQQEPTTDVIEDQLEVGKLGRRWQL